MLKYVYSLALSSLLYFLSFSPIKAASWYIDNQAGGSNNGTSWTNAWKSFSAIVWNNVKPGDILYISGGTTLKTYNETLTIEANGLSGSPITIDVGANSPFPTGHDGVVEINPGNSYAIGIGNSSISRSYITINGDSNGNYKLSTRNTTTAAIYIRSSKNININHIKITNTKDRGVFIDGYGTRASNITVNGCDIATGIIQSGTQTDLIYGQLVDDVVIENNILTHGDTNNLHSDNIQFANNWKRLTIRNNWIAKLPATGEATDQQIIIQHENATASFEWAKIYNNIIIGGEYKRWGTIIASPNTYGGLYYFWNNTIIGKYNDNSLDGVVVQITGNIGEFKNNIVTGYNSVLVQGNSSFTSANVTNNCFYNTTSKALTNPSVTNTDGVNDINCSYNITTYQLNSGSPCIDKGLNLNNYFTTDRNGINRPVGAGWDIGAYEYVSGGSFSPTPYSPSSTIKLTATPTIMTKLGDTNNDGKVNGTDYSTWSNNYTKTLIGKTYGDFNNDGVVNGIDYTIWFNNYGK